LGWKFLAKDGSEIVRWTDLARLNALERPVQLPRGIVVAVDVQNPLLGRRGATRVYGPQKGIEPGDVAVAERALRRLARVVQRQLGGDCATLPGAGAAGGLGFGLASFAGGQLTSGFGLFARHAGLNALLARTDLIVTAEGALDRSTLMGKGAGQIAALGRRRGIPLLGLAGCVCDMHALRRWFEATHALTELTTRDQAQHRAALWLARLAEAVARETAAVDVKQVGKRGVRG
jgi:glycerate kinase